MNREEWKFVLGEVGKWIIAILTVTAWMYILDAAAHYDQVMKTLR
jgi:hypothetical protein